VRLAGKRALITGGGSGIGRAIALAFAGEGCQVAIAGRNQEKLDRVAAESSGKPPIVSHPVDVANRDSVDALFRWAADSLGPIDILVNNAGINLPTRTMVELAPEDWDRLLAVNATGAYNCLRAVLPQMRQREDGLVINISSISGKRAGVLGGVGYNASKFAMTALATTVSIEEGRRHIRVSSIFPGEVDTPILEHRPTPVSAERRAQILQPEDVAAAALMIACLPPRAHVQELIIKPTVHEYL
jgi:NAD(P)-dependent dehydrogenase (short-subunit alcohol dehydrogenase family)